MTTSMRGCCEKCVLRNIAGESLDDCEDSSCPCHKPIEEKAHTDGICEVFRPPHKEKEPDDLDEVVRDICALPYRSKSEVRRVIESLLSSKKKKMARVVEGMKRSEGGTDMLSNAYNGALTDAASAIRSNKC